MFKILFCFLKRIFCVTNGIQLLDNYFSHRSGHVGVVMSSLSPSVMNISELCCDKYLQKYLDKHEFILAQPHVFF